ncbi:hypothetical protein GLW08_08630 [Pontibacillus yanchengensis]|uniref:Uncharacterized protein n=2 Tax=Pontibacillus yanchengensis TaxID=462910 RepID=A0ACC7VF43_9BACI|nr:hypothetical protein [Pontibacillus yanchengensis]MYL33354.1 hypothetical protein [Pontibacillus yanchengensis]MYL53403.1 hypothetical protein [Pontibacillus yanchengensis]
MRESDKEVTTKNRHNSELIGTIHLGTMDTVSQKSLMTEPFGVKKEDVKKVKQSMERS